MLGLQSTFHPRPPLPRYVLLFFFRGISANACFSPSGTAPWHFDRMRPPPPISPLSLYGYCLITVTRSPHILQTFDCLTDLFRRTLQGLRPPSISCPTFHFFFDSTTSERHRPQNASPRSLKPLHPLPIVFSRILCRIYHVIMSVTVSDPLFFVTSLTAADDLPSRTVTKEHPSPRTCLASFSLDSSGLLHFSLAVDTSPDPRAFPVSLF